jgi:CubicO group peptidase (beta-lactamase class C family)
MHIGLALALWLAGTAAALAALPDDVASRARAIAEEERARAGTPAMTVAVFSADGEVVDFALGQADVENGVAATPETLFMAASVTKILTAALVMQGVERGKLSLDAPVNDSLPPERQVRDASGAPVPVTLRMLLSHSSGLPVSWQGIQSDPNEPPRSLDDLLAHGLRTIRAPREHLIYANDGFALAGWLAARAEGVSFDELARRDLFEPLRMTHSTLVPPRDAGPALAAAYGGGGPFGGKARVPHQTVSGTAPAGALITTATDLARFGTAILRGGELDGARVLAPESVAELERMQARAHPRMPEGFGLGFGVREVPGRTLVWWDGSLAGAASRLALLPEHGVGVAILSNLSDNGPVAAAGNRILAELVPPPPAGAAPPADDALAGTWRFVDVVDPSVSYLAWLANLRLVRDGDGFRAHSPLTAEPTRLSRSAEGRYELHGGMFDGANVIVDGDTLYTGFVRAQRIPVWQSARALFAYAGIAALALVSALVIAIVRLVRRRRVRRLVL